MKTTTIQLVNRSGKSVSVPCLMSHAVNGYGQKLTYLTVQRIKEKTFLRLIAALEAEDLALVVAKREEYGLIMLRYPHRAAYSVRTYARLSALYLADYNFAPEDLRTRWISYDRKALAEKIAYEWERMQKAATEDFVAVQKYTAIEAKEMAF